MRNRIYSSTINVPEWHTRSQSKSQISLLAVINGRITRLEFGATRLPDSGRYSLISTHVCASGGELITDMLCLWIIAVECVKACKVGVEWYLADLIGK